MIIRVILSGQDSLGLRVPSCGEVWRQNPCNSEPLDCQLPRMLVARAGILPDPLPSLGRWLGQRSCIGLSATSRRPWVMFANIAVLVLIRSLFWYCFDTAAASLFQFSQYTCLGSDVWRDNIMFRARPEARSQIFGDHTHSPDEWEVLGLM